MSLRVCSMHPPSHLGMVRGHWRGARGVCLPCARARHTYAARAGWRHARACVLDPTSLDELFPRPDGDPDLDHAWATRGAPVTTKVARSRLALLTARRHWTLPRTQHLRFRHGYLVQHRCARVPTPWPGFA